MRDVVDVQKARDDAVRLELTVDVSAYVNFSSAQNGASVLRRLTLSNHGSVAVKGLQLTLSCRPAVIREKSWGIDEILPGGKVEIDDLTVSLDMEYLRGLNEAERGELVFQVSGGESVLQEFRQGIDLLAKDQWGGYGESPYLLAAFVWPNDPLVASVLKEASRILENAGYDPSLDGYQSADPARVWMLAGAIWASLTALNLSYSVPPASFEQQGQKIRSPERIRDEGLATCLDTALLLAACFEAIGLNTNVLFSKGHAWVGVWLKDQDFGSVIETDVVAVRKAIAAKELVVLETTLLTKRPVCDLRAAFDAGVEHTAEENEHLFLLAVDIRRARAARIRPLANHSPIGELRSLDDSRLEVGGTLPAPLKSGELPTDIGEPEPQSASDRIDRWQRKLLDLSLRNRLLNFNDSMQTLPLVCPDVAALEDLLAAGKRFKMLSLDDENPLESRALQAQERRAILDGVVRSAFDRLQIAVPLHGKDMNIRLVELFRRAKSDQQEGGANTLYLAVGFLHWKKQAEDTRSYRAPLLLIPVKLSRRSATSDFILEHHEDEAHFNATLLEFLKRDYDLSIPELEGDLPRDQSGYDLSRVFEVMRQKVRDVPGFEVVEDIALSTFSFAKFLMWKDLVDRTESLRQSRLVRHLIDNPTEPFLSADDPGLPRADEVDQRIRPKDLFTLLPADSSQLAAVVAAQEGRDFVLIGPPGTGKSQTIANIIAQCLAIGKTVLFVAEKSAALDVVYRRLAAHGLADAVLELHSSKADRRSVLGQLGRSWDRLVQEESPEWVQVTESLGLARDDLNAYVQALHAVGTQGFSVYQAVGRAMKTPWTSPFELAFEKYNTHDVASYAALRQLVEDLQRTHQILDGRPVPALIESDNWSFAWQQDVLRVGQGLLDNSRHLLTLAQDLAQRFGLQPDNAGAVDKIANLLTVAQVMQGGPNVSWILGQDLISVERDATILATSLESLRIAREALSAQYGLDKVVDIPLDELHREWDQAQQKIWPLSVLARSGVRKRLQVFANTDVVDPGRDLPGLKRVCESLAQIQSNQLCASPAFLGPEMMESVLLAWVADAVQCAKALTHFEGYVADDAAWRSVAHAVAAREDQVLQEALLQFIRVHQAWQAAATDFSRLSGGDLSRSDLATLSEQLSTTLAAKESLQDWGRWVGIRNRAHVVGLGPVVDALEQGRLNIPAAPAFDQAYAIWWLPLAMDAEPVLRDFAQWSHEDLIQRFRCLVDRAEELAAHQVLQRVQHRLPHRDSVPKKSELGVLRHQLGLQRPSMPIRALISSMPTAFPTLAPCVLMSPLSVSQYLPAEQALFDVVLFDEASQITTWDAVGAIARGKQAIIVGDPKQLPPTNFFGRADTEEYLPEIERDMTSILDEVVASGIPTRQLNWHYRSQDESLIAFSNWNYYAGQLVTFPSPATESSAVQLHQINGVYGRGKGRTNEAEARAITRMVVHRLTAWLAVPEANRQTLGVITFNVQQQELILDLLDAARRSDGRLEWFFDEAREEPVIVKNLENIQGDERDVMLFSITFGADAAGKISMAFGAINGDGGERRLNVAVTRARRELHVFSSLRADQIDLNRTRSLGVKHLKEFLDFAARGAAALPAQIDGSQGNIESPFEEAVMQALQTFGWECRPQIGVSGFRIDFGVVHPDHAGVYLAGVECDGATYHRSATARDRDKIRQAVLERLGWSILRIWSTDWFKNPQAGAQRVHEALQKLLDQDRCRRTDEASETMPQGLDILSTEIPSAEELEGGIAASSGALENDVQDGESEVAETFARGPGWNADLAGCASVDGQFDDLIPDANRFFQTDYDAVLRGLVAREVSKMGPLPLAVVCRQIAQLHGWQRTGRRIVERVSQSLTLVDQFEEEGDVFLWTRGSYESRISFRHDLNRELRDISRTEVAALYDAHAERLDRSVDPVRDLARLAGVARLSTDARSYLDQCLKWRAGSD